MSSFPVRLKELREENNLSMSELARRLKISNSQISVWERAEKEPTLRNLLALCKFFGCSMDYLTGLSDT